MQTFVRIVEAGSLSAAAAQMGTTQPTVSRRLQALERSLQERLTPREAEVLRLRYGLSDNRERTLAEVGKELGISRERARQLEAEAMRKLRRDVTFRRELSDR